ncbi:hypothetical protein PEC301875_09300 [Pectobacterium carotovorum subsp. carotovorum]|nr:hypothetical protein PEC301875_09300 [Pectobacterium carotovorum subsp. carotovorum]
MLCAICYKRRKKLCIGGLDRRVSGMDAAKVSAASDKNVETFLNSTCAGPKGEPHLWGE